MHKQTPNNTFIYLPALHPELLPEDFPSGEVFFMPCGIESTASSAGIAIPKQIKDKLPLQGKAAEAVLREMLTLAAERVPASLASYQKGIRQTAMPFAVDGETVALRRFSTDGSVENTRQNENNTSFTNAAIACQKILLLAYALESQFLDIRQLEIRINEQERLLKEALHAEIEESPDTPPLVSLEPDTYQTPYAQDSSLWKRTLEAMLAFTPQNTYFVTKDPAIIADLLERGLLTRPSEAEKLLISSFWENHGGDSMICSTTAWRLLGYASIKEAPAWLHQPLMLFALLSSSDTEGAHCVT